ncbi:aminotransferase [Stutzerimonas kirkiae]|uniref:Aminotransferase n=1 Tax=Stutzerimonas kirkiae TaxID=2211392 RepID=A0A4Q9QW26_9GAMM|nr:aminotransferase class V-fold PLP-dependent enzyme [Stutzerimonas kirkiae]TBU88045.1 aminotransferase [Stutzerimonas kirkiae]TBU98202.1 aminotransferase [Stutzerimonas kirkiae]
MNDRRSFLKQAGLLTASLSLGTGLNAHITKASAAPAADKWSQFRRLFSIDERYIHLANFLIAPHPLPVKEAIEAYRAELDANPGLMMDYDRQTTWKNEHNVRSWAARYLEVEPGQIALTGSTTQGLALVYGGIHITPGQEILTGTHEHSSSYAALEFRNQSDGTPVRHISLFQDPHQVSVDEVLGNLQRNLRPNTRVIGMTWVHSGSGVKLPIKEIGQWIREQNKKRDKKEHILFCVDGVHGFGVEDVRFADLNCDFLIAGTHKWLFGPRGTGIICAASEELNNISPTQATFSPHTNFGTIMSPGGYHAFEHRWALAKAFELHLQLGKNDIQQRIHALNSYCKQRLQELTNVELVTPLSPELSAGFTFFRIAGQGDQEGVGAYLIENRVIADAVDRDAGPVLRLAPGLLNNEAEIDKVIELLSQRFTASI